MFQIEISEREKYDDEYIPPTLQTVEAHGGRVIVSAENPQVIEGEWDYNQTVVLEFPSVEDAQEWYHDEDYEEIKQIRFATTETNNAIIVPEHSP